MPPSVQELQKQADLLQAQLKKAQADEAELEKVRSTPRAPEVVLTNLLEAIAMRLGNRPELKLLLAEYKAATKQEEPPAPDEPLAA